MYAFLPPDLTPLFPVRALRTALLCIAVTRTLAGKTLYTCANACAISRLLASVATLNTYARTWLTSVDFSVIRGLIKTHERSALPPPTEGVVGFVSVFCFLLKRDI